MHLQSSEHHRLPHNLCFACSPEHPHGLQLDFDTVDSQQLQSTFRIDSSFQGYDGCIHGGIIATVLDASMTRLLLQQGIHAMTAKLEVRYKKPLRPQVDAAVRAILVTARPPLFELQSKITQAQHTIALATASFMLPGCEIRHEI